MRGFALMLAEKPSAARNFAAALGGDEGTFDGTPFRIYAMRGHALGLAAPAEQVAAGKRERYANWSLSALPWDPADLSWEKVPRDGGQEVLDGLARALRGASEVVIATDVDPSGEGELLAWEALQRVGWSGRTTRMYHEDESQRCVAAAFRARREVSADTDGDLRKATCRERWDYLSMQWTRAATRLAAAHGFRAVVREGRLKSVMVSLVGAQEDAWRAYRKVPFFEARFRDEAGVTYAVPKDRAERVPARGAVDLSRLRPSGVTEDSRVDESRAPGRLLDLAGLSAILASEHGSKPGEVLETYQRMYEDQVVSYPRTEDRTVTPEQFAELLLLADRIARVVGVDPALLTHREPRGGFVRPGGAHGANRPGPQVPASLESLGRYGRSAAWIYETLARNYLATLAEDCRLTVVRGHVTDFPDFVGRATVVRSPGYRAVFDTDDRERDGGDGESAEGTGLGTRAEPFVFEGCNKRAPRPTMKWLKARLERHDVGTGTTRTSTLADISDGTPRALLAESRGTLSLTECGRASYTLLDGCAIASPEATERLFGDMARVGRGELGMDRVIEGVAPMLMDDVRRM
ncbi:MAG: DNA topoisomerase [Coriobacteriaceae bacterium]|nr:DNA topoisomerase [Coriobacteriaceae bacterium]